MVYVELAHSSAASTWSACHRSWVCLLQLAADPGEAVVARLAFTLDVRYSSDLVSMIHAVLENSVFQAE